jgi:hypothetical protein
MKKLIAIAVPILPGKTEHFHKFTSALKGEKSSEFKASRERLEVRERTFLQETPDGDMVIVTLEGKNPEAALSKLGEGKDAFTKWFVSEVKEIHGLDLTTLPKDEMTELVVDSRELVRELA